MQSSEDSPPKDVTGWVVRLVCIFAGFPLCINNRKSSRESIPLDPILGPFQLLPPHIHRKRRLQSTKLIGVPKDALLSLHSSQFPISQGRFPITNFVPPLLLHLLFSSVLLLLSCNTGAEASACPSLLAWGRGMWPLPPRGSQAQALTQAGSGRQAGSRAGEAPGTLL